MEQFNHLEVGREIVKKRLALMVHFREALKIKVVLDDTKVLFMIFYDPSPIQNIDSVDRKVK